MHQEVPVLRFQLARISRRGADAPSTQDAYIDALFADLEASLPLIWGRSIQTVFLGGGTPSLFSPEAIDRLVGGIRARVRLAPDAEVTMEANPGTFEKDRFKAFRQAGITRLSIGVQSFDNAHLKALGPCARPRPSSGRRDRSGAGV